LRQRESREGWIETEREQRDGLRQRYRERESRGMY
jgi:hypothetical protein